MKVLSAVDVRNLLNGRSCEPQRGLDPLINVSVMPWFGSQERIKLQKLILIVKA